jgi:hypothetical protein
MLSVPLAGRVPPAAAAKPEKKRWWETDTGAATVEEMQDVYGGHRRADNTLEVSRELDDFERLGLLGPSDAPKQSACSGKIFFPCLLSPSTLVGDHDIKHSEVMILHKLDDLGRLTFMTS